MPSETSRSAGSQRLRKNAEKHRKKARDRIAVALAMEDGAMDDEEAHEYLSLTDEMSKVQSDLYPGDDYYDRAEAELGRGDVL